MANVQIISTSVIQATSHTRNPNEKIDLTPWDLQFLPLSTIQKGLLFLKPKQPQQNDEQSPTQSTLIEHLQASLSRTLDFYAPFAGRLKTIKDGNNTAIFIDCNNEGAQFVHAAADGVSIADIIEPEYVPSVVSSFFLLNGVKNYEGVRKPLLAVQVTELVDGIFIGFTVNHAVADGTSLWHFINSWAEISRGFGQVSKPPALRRWVPGSIKCPIWIPISYDEIPSAKLNVPRVKERVFHFTGENIAGLKAKANAEVGTNKISSLQALLAHLWRSVIRSRNWLEPDQETHYIFLIGARSRLHQFPKHYFGNAVQPGTVTLKAKDVLNNGLGFVAENMNRMVAEHSEEKLRDFLKSSVENPKLLVDFPTDALLTSSSPRFNMYGNDFGWGRPIAVRSGAGNKLDGKITMFEGAEEGSVDIEACLSPETLEAMVNDTEFMDAVTIK